MKIRVISTLAVLMMVAAVYGAQDSGNKHINLPRPAGLANLPFSDAVVAGDTLYIAGHIGVDAKTGQPPASVEEEARLAMDGIKDTLSAAGMTTDDLVSVQVHCSDLGLYDTFNKVYESYFHGEYPARAFLGGAKLLRGAHFEVLGTAVKRAR